MEPDTGRSRHEPAVKRSAPPIRHIIQRIYKTRSVAGRSGQVHKLHSAIDRLEGEFIFDMIHHDARVLRTLEVGCGYGLSSLYICLGLRGRADASHTIIDPFQNSFFDGGGIMHLEEAGISFFNLIETKSEFALPRFIRRGRRAARLHIHRRMAHFDHTLLDCFYANRLLRTGGYLVLDDVNLPRVSRAVRFLKTYPCYKEHGSVRHEVPGQSWKRTVVKGLMSPVSQGAWSSILPPTLHRRLFDNRLTRMIALKKTKEDTRDWDWHNDAF